jgi:hypothetical protein
MMFWRWMTLVTGLLGVVGLLEGSFVAGSGLLLVAAYSLRTARG